jgi:hypothetical protein
MQKLLKNTISFISSCSITTNFQNHFSTDHKKSIAMFTESVLPLSLNEFMELATAVPEHKLNDNDEIEIVANEERAVVRDRHSRITIAWIKRHQRKLAPTG